jgi:hypothetical protein
VLYSRRYVTNHRSRLRKWTLQTAAPVDLPEGAPVQVEPRTFPVEEYVRERLLAEGADLEAIESALANLRLAWSAFADLSPEEEAALEKARFDQQNFVAHLKP